LKVRTSIEPSRVLDVDEGEYLDLKRQGLLLPDPAEEQRAAEKPAAKTTKKED